MKMYSLPMSMPQIMHSFSKQNLIDGYVLQLINSGLQSSGLLLD